MVYGVSYLLNKIFVYIKFAGCKVTDILYCVHLYEGIQLNENLVTMDVYLSTLVTRP